jgi:phage terminase large subunit-like protein
LPGFAGFRSFTRRLILDNGDPFVLEPAQSRIMKAHFAGWTEVCAIIPTGNGKSTLLAARGLHHMLTTPQAECIVAAASADQAAIMFDQMAGFVERSELALDVKRGIRAIYHQGEGPNRKPLGRIRVISADASKNSGAIPSLVLVDELQAHPDGHLYNMLQQRLNKRHAQMLTISNAGWDEKSFLAQMRQRAYEHDSFVRKGMLNTAEVGSMAFFEWCLGDADDPRNVRTVKRANPLKAVKVEDLTRRLESPGLIWPEWLRATCGRWTIAETPWLGEDGEAVWDGLELDVGGLSDGDEVYLAVRCGAGAGIGIASPRAEAVVGGIEYLPAPHGGRVPLEHVEQRIRQLAKRFKILQVAYDPDQFRRSAEILEAEHLPMIEVPQRPQRLAQATATIWRLISAGLLHHDGDPELRSQALAGRTKETTGGWRLDPTPETVALIALAMACHEATQTPAEPPTFIAV